MKILNFFVLFLMATPAFAGSFTGNGADRKGPGHGAAWFLGDRTVHWCGNHEAIQPALEKARKKWADYIEKKEIADALKAPLPFALRFEKQGSCKGADLEIELSEDSSATTLSISELLEQDLKNGWGRGRIWISASLLSTPGALETQLIHQLGHLLGHDHVGGTVMAEKIADGAASPPVHLNIDGNRELYLCQACVAEWKAADGRVYREENGAADITGANAHLQFTADLALNNHDDAKIFHVATGDWSGYLHSQSLARVGLLELEGRSEQVIVRRNFDKLVEIHILRGGQPELFFEAQ